METFKTFRNEAVKLLVKLEVASRARVNERRCQVQQPQQQTLFSGSSATSTFVPQRFQQPQQPASAPREYILTIPETQIPASQLSQSAQYFKSSSVGSVNTSQHSILGLSTFFGNIFLFLFLMVTIIHTYQFIHAIRSYTLYNHRA